MQNMEFLNYFSCKVYWQSIEKVNSVLFQFVSYALLMEWSSFEGTIFLYIYLQKKICYIFRFTLYTQKSQYEIMSIINVAHL